MQAGNRETFGEAVAERSWQLQHGREIGARMFPQMGASLRAAECTLAELGGELTELTLSVFGHHVEEISDLDRRRSRGLLLHFQSFHQLIAMTKFNALTSRPRPDFPAPVAPPSSGHAR